jgi:two-component system, LuxR family, response regulator FixJ
VAPAEPTVFLVDDDPEAMQAIASLIRSAGLPVQTHHSTQAFLKAFSPICPGCVVCNDHISGRSGLELLSRLRATGSEIPVLFLTGRGDVPTAVRAIKAGAIDVLEKPVEDGVLLERVRGAIERDAADRAAHPERIELARRYHSLSDRERIVFALVVQGLSSREIAERLGAKLKTIEAQRGSVMRKMEADSAAHLARMSALLPDLPVGRFPAEPAPPATG